jgi:hypothetical protein
VPPVAVEQCHGLWGQACLKLLARRCYHTFGFSEMSSAQVLASPAAFFVACMLEVLMLSRWSGFCG